MQPRPSHSRTTSDASDSFPSTLSLHHPIDNDPTPTPTRQHSLSGYDSARPAAKSDPRPVIFSSPEQRHHHHHHQHHPDGIYRSPEDIRAQAPPGETAPHPNIGYYSQQPTRRPSGLYVPPLQLSRGPSPSQTGASHAPPTDTIFNHSRKRSQTLPETSITHSVTQGADSFMHEQTPHQQFGLGGASLAAPSSRFEPGSFHSIHQGTGPNMAPLPPSLSTSHYLRTHQSGPTQYGLPPVPEKEGKPGKDKPKMKLFSKPKNITLAPKDNDKRQAPLPSPSARSGGFSKHLSPANVDGPSSFYSSLNASASVLSVSNLSLNQHTGDEKDREKEKHKHHFLSRQKTRQKEELASSSTAAGSRPADPTGAQPLYSFAVASTSTFSKSVSGFDLRHGGKALREKRKETKEKEKESRDKPGIGTIVLNNSPESQLPFSSQDASGAIPLMWPPVRPSTSAGAGRATDYSTTPSEIAAVAASFACPSLQPTEVWMLFSSRVLRIFDGEEVRTPVEDFNALLVIHIRNCILHRMPRQLLNDFKELLQTGYAVLDRFLSQANDDSFLMRLVRVWTMVFNHVLPFLEAVMFPLDQEIRGSSQIFSSSEEAEEFWRALSPGSAPSFNESSDGLSFGESSFWANMDQAYNIRRITLLMFRDLIILPRHDVLAQRFSRLSFDSLNPDVRNSPHANHQQLQQHLQQQQQVQRQQMEQQRQEQMLRTMGPNSSGLALDMAARSRAASSVSAVSLASTFSRYMPSTPANVSGLDTPPLSAANSMRPSSSAGGSSATVIAPTAIQNGSGHASGNVNSSNSALFDLEPAASSNAAGLLRAAVGDSGHEVTQAIAQILQCVAILAGLQSGNEAQEKMDQLSRDLKTNWFGRGRTGRDRRGFVTARVVKT